MKATKMFCLLLVFGLLSCVDKEAQKAVVTFDRLSSTIEARSEKNLIYQVMIVAYNSTGSSSTCFFDSLYRRSFKVPVNLCDSSTLNSYSRIDYNVFVLLENSTTYRYRGSSDIGTVGLDTARLVLH